MNRPWEFQKNEAPIFQDSLHMKAVRFPALNTGYIYPPGNIPGTRIWQTLSRSQGHGAAGRIMNTKNSNVTFGNRTRVLPAFSAVSRRITAEKNEL